MSLQAACPAGGGGAAAPAGDGGEEGDFSGETSEDERTSKNFERQERKRQRAAGLRQAGTALQVNRPPDFHNKRLPACPLLVGF